jgi:ribose transport system substrate-binding protein
LLRQNVDVLLYWAVDERSLGNTLEKAVAAGIPTVNAFGGFSTSPGTVSNAYISQLLLSQMVAQHLMDDIGGKGNIIAILPIPGTQEAADQLTGLRYVLKKYPKVNLLNVSYGLYNRAKAKQIMENLLQRYPQIDGVFSPSGNMDVGIVEAIEEADRLSEIKMSPGDELNGWLKWVVKHHQAGAVTFPPKVGKVAVELGLKILKGEPVPRGQRIPSVYISPAQAASLVDEKASDDSWAGDLPAQFQPK